MKMKTSRYWDPPHSPVLQSCCCYFLLHMCQQVGSPSPVFPDEMPVHRAEEQSTTLNHLPGASVEPSPTICGYHSIPSEATLSFCFYLSVLLCLVDWRCPPNKVRISQLQRRQSAGRKQPARRPSVQAAPRCTTTGGFRFVPEVWTLTATRGWRFIKLKVLLSLCKFIYLLTNFLLALFCVSQVILAQMEVYEKSLKQAQRGLLRKAEWGEAILPQPEVPQTVYNWLRLCNSQLF